MRKRLLVAVAVAGGLFTAAIAPQAAGALPVPKLESGKSDVTLARHGFGGFRGGFRGFRGGNFRAFRGGNFRAYRGRRFGGIYRHRGYRWRHHYRRRFYYFPYAAYGYYYGGYYGYGGRCGWLRRRALRTGSHYWWRRYRRCVSYYY